MLMYCHLDEIMHELGLENADVQKRCGLTRKQVGSFRQNDFKRIDRELIPKLVLGLEVPFERLFSIYEADPWYPVRKHRQLTVHLGCDTYPIGHEAPTDGAFGRYSYGAWDVNTWFEGQAFLNEFKGKITVDFREHDRGADPERDKRLISDVFEKGGDHLIIGSPIANRFTEFVVSKMYKVSPFTESAHSDFPMNFVWDSKVPTPSSFGYQGEGNTFGIISTKTSRFAAERTFVAQGEGLDCALIVVLRVLSSKAERDRFGSNDERVIICLIGHSGLGTQAALRVLKDRRHAGALWPPARQAPLMRVVSARYSRDPGSNGRDNRVLTGWELAEVTTAASLSGKDANGAETIVKNPPTGASRSPIAPVPTPKPAPRRRK